MDVRSHIPISNKDDSWWIHYSAKITEDGIFRMRDYIYDLCDKLKVGEHLDLETWINHTHKKCVNFENWSKKDTTDLFIKLIWCYLTEHRDTYIFSNDLTQFRHYFDARTLEKQSTLYNRKYQDKNTRTNGGGTWLQTVGTETIPDP